MAVELLRRRFSIEEYHRMGPAGILSEDDRVELIEGQIVVMPPIGSAHAGKLNRLGRLFTVGLGQRAIIAIQNPIALPADTEPQPDLAILRPRTDFYERSHPRPEDVLLLVEIAEASLEYDRTVKVPLYARAGLPEVWIVDLAAESLEIYQEPREGRYRRVQALTRGQSLAPQAFPDLLVSTDEIFG